MHTSILLVLNLWNSFETIKDQIYGLLIGALKELLPGKRKAKSELEEDRSFVADNKYACFSS